MTKEQIKQARRDMHVKYREEWCSVVETVDAKYKKFFAKIVNDCEKYEGHEYRESYYNWGSWDERKWTHTAMRCRWCDDMIYVPNKEAAQIRLDKGKRLTK